MAGETQTAYMNLSIPEIGVTSGTDAANDVNNNFNILDYHDHSQGLGYPISPGGLNINSDLSIKSNNLTYVRSVNLSPAQAATLSSSSDNGAIYITGVDLYYNDLSGNIVRLTSGGNVNGSAGSISGLTSPASASYSGSTFVFQSAASTAANLDCRSILLRNSTASSHALTLNPPLSMAADYSLTLPTIPPSSPTTTYVMTISNTGAMSFNTSNINLPGTSVQAGSKNVVASLYNATNGLAIVRGTINSNGTIASGEGFSVTHSTTGSYVITLTDPLNIFSDTPVCTLATFSATVYANIVSIDSSGDLSIAIHTTGTSTLVNGQFSFIMIGQRLL